MTKYSSHISFHPSIFIFIFILVSLLLLFPYSTASIHHSSDSSEHSIQTNIPQNLPSIAHRYPEQLTLQSNHPISPPDSNSRLYRHAQLSTSLLGKISSNITFDPRLDRFLTQFNPATILQNINALSNGVGDARWTTRHSYSQGALRAVNWLKKEYEKLSDGNETESTIRCEFDYYLDGVAPNLICKMIWSFNHNIQPNHTKVEETVKLNYQRNQLEEQGQHISPDHHSVILTAHYDSKGSFGSIEAPGTDDNASGCAVLLSIAQLLNKHKSEIANLKKSHLDWSKLDLKQKLPKKNKLNSKFELIFIHFSGTEQGLLGSQSVSKRIGHDLIGIDQVDPKLVLLLMNVNMVSYRVLYEPRQMGLSHLGCSSESLEFLTRISNVYVPELLVGNTSIGLSDEVNFQSVGIPNSIRIFESLGDSIKNPNYLKSSDQFSNFLKHDHLDSREVGAGESGGFYDIIQTALISKVLLASVLELLLS